MSVEEFETGLKPAAAYFLIMFFVLSGLTISCGGTNTTDGSQLANAPIGASSIPTQKTTFTATHTSTQHPSATATHQAPSVTTTIENVFTQSTETYTPIPEYQTELISCKRDGCIYTANQILMRPISSDFNQKVEKTYRYGSTQQGARIVHSGVEFENPMGTPVIAAENGRVVYAGDDFTVATGPWIGFYGNLIILQHDLPGMKETVYTLYGHLSALDVKNGDKVLKGQIIGKVGKSGSAAGSHLHFEVRVGENLPANTVNPELWIESTGGREKTQNNGTLVLKMLYHQSTIYSVNVSIQDYTDIRPVKIGTIYAETYALGTPQDEFWMENLVVGDIPPGIYRVSFMRFDRSYQKYIEIEAGRITLVEFKIEY